MNEKIIYKDLSYKIVGIVYKVYNDLGYGYQEKYYKNAISLEFDKEHLGYNRKKEIKLNYSGKNIGRYFLDFIIENKIILEIKITNYFHSRDIKQILGYLKSAKLKLGILVLVTPNGIKCKRIINPTGIQ